MKEVHDQPNQDDKPQLSINIIMNDDIQPG